MSPVRISLRYGLTTYGLQTDARKKEQPRPDRPGADVLRGIVQLEFHQEDRRIWFMKGSGMKLKAVQFFFENEA